MHATCQPTRRQVSCVFSSAWVADGPRTTPFNFWPDVVKLTRARIFLTSSTAHELVNLPTTSLLHVSFGMILSLIQGSAPETVNGTLDVTFIEAGHFCSNYNPRQQFDICVDTP